MTESILERTEIEYPIVYEDLFEIEGLERHFNAGAWMGSDDSVRLLARFAQEASPEGEPDRSSMISVKLTENHLAVLPTSLEEIRTDMHSVLSRREVWSPKDQVKLLEDPRVMVLTHDPSRIMIGLTEVSQAPNGVDYLPFAAFSFTSRDEIPDNLKPDIVLDQFGPAKNATPVDDDTVLIRQEGRENDHQLLVVKLDKETLTVREDGRLKFPTNMPGATYRMGSAMPPIWVNQNEALMIVHGIEIVNGKYVYSLFSSQLRRGADGKLSIAMVNPQPILHPDHLKSPKLGPVVELHDNRRVVYNTGGVLKNDDLFLMINAGDSRTIGARYKLRTLMSSYSWNQPATRAA